VQLRSSLVVKIVGQNSRSCWGIPQEEKFSAVHAHYEAGIRYDELKSRHELKENCK